MGLGSLRCPSEMEKPFNMQPTIDHCCLPSANHCAMYREPGSDRLQARQIWSSPHDFMGSGSSQVQADTCFSDYLRVIFRGKNTCFLLTPPHYHDSIGLEWTLESVFLTLSEGHSHERPALGTTDLMYSTT